MVAPNTTDPPPPTVKVEDLPEAHRLIVESHRDSGYRFRERRRQNLRIAQTSAGLNLLAGKAMDLQREYRTKLRESKDQRNALMDRKRELLGVLNETEERIESCTDPLGRALSEDDRGLYAVQWATKRDEFEAFEEERKATLQANAEEIAEITDRCGKLSAEIKRKTRVAPVWLALLERDDGTQILVRLDTGEVISTRAGDRIPGQADLFGEDVTHEPLNDEEYAYAVQERFQDAAASYAKRHELPVDKALTIVRKLATAVDDELPPEIDQPKAAEGDGAASGTAEGEANTDAQEHVSLWTVEVSGWNKRKSKTAMPVLKQVSRYTETFLTERLAEVKGDETLTVWCGSSKGRAEAVVAQLEGVGVVASVEGTDIDGDDIAVYVIGAGRERTIELLVLCDFSAERAAEIADGSVILGTWRDAAKIIRSDLTIEVVEDPNVLADRR
jgi:hypothetical protein